MSTSTFDTTKLSLKDLLKDIRSGRMQLPDFQRGWVWDVERIRSLLASIAQSFPIGAVMLLETGGDDVLFKPRPVEGTQIEVPKEPEILILDGQQRFTSLYQALIMHNPVNTTTVQKKKIERYYYFNMRSMVNGEIDEEEAILSIPSDRQIKSDFGRSVDLDVSIPELEYQHLLFPVNQIFNASPWRRSFNRHWNHDEEKSLLFDDFDEQVISRFEQYLVPIIQLGKATPKEAVCIVFEKVNTGGVPLTVFELLTATFAAENFQLREDWDAREKRLKGKYKALGSMQSDDFLQAISLLVTQARRQRSIVANISGEKLPGISCKRRDILRLTVVDYLQWADLVEEGFGRAARFLHSQNIFRTADVPYRTQIVPLAAAYVTLGKEAESVGSQKQVAHWYWCGVLGELYGGAVESRFARDLPELVDYVRNSDAEPKTVQDSNFDANRLLSLRTRNSAAYKGIHALLMRAGCRDFRTGDPITLQTFFDDSIDIHHIFPKKWCRNADIKPQTYNSIINKTAISARTNRIIGGLAPSRYLGKLESEAMPDRVELSAILETHGITPDHLYSDDFDQFFARRGLALVELIEKATGKPVAREGADFLDLEANDEYEDDSPDWESEGDSEEFEEANDFTIPYDSSDGRSEQEAQPPDTGPDNNVEQRFHEEMIAIYETADREIDYRPTYFLQMVTENGGLEAARRLLRKAELPEGFTTLWVNDRLDLSVEAHVIKPQYRQLFTTEEIAVAEQRLSDVDYKFNE